VRNVVCGPALPLNGLWYFIKCHSILGTSCSGIRKVPVGAELKCV
jgi:hypothetical protein